MRSLVVKQNKQEVIVAQSLTAAEVHHVNKTVSLQRAAADPGSLNVARRGRCHFNKSSESEKFFEASKWI